MTTDKALLRNRFAANLRNYNSLAVVQEKICAELSEMIGQFCTLPKNIMEVGAGTGFLSRQLLKLYPSADFTINDIVEEAETYITPSLSGEKVQFIWGDAESIAFPSNLDLMATASTIQWFDNIPLFIAHAHKALNTGGYLALSTFGVHNFAEIKATTGEGLTYYAADQLREILHRNGLKEVETVEYTKTLLFSSPTDVLRHIKATGVNSIRKVRWTKNDLEQFEREYRAKFTSGNGQVTLTYHPILIIAQNIK